jgi:hypothetical protein
LWWKGSPIVGWRRNSYSDTNKGIASAAAIVGGEMDERTQSLVLRRLVPHGRTADEMAAPS